MYDAKMAQLHISPVSAAVAIHRSQRFAPRSALRPAGKVHAPLSPTKASWVPSNHFQRPTCKARSASLTTADPEADTIEVELKVDGMVCENCSARVQDTLIGMDIVNTADVSHQTGIATLQVNATDMFDAFNQLPLLVEAVKSLGFEAEPYFEQ